MISSILSWVALVSGPKGIWRKLVNAFLDENIFYGSKLVLLWKSWAGGLDPIQLIDEGQSEKSRIVQIDCRIIVAHYMALADVLVHSSHRERAPKCPSEAGSDGIAPVICPLILLGNRDIYFAAKKQGWFSCEREAVLKRSLRIRICEARIKWLNLGKEILN